MREVKLRMKEQEKYEIIKNLVDKNGNKKRASLKLGISERQINRLIIKYKEKGKSAFIHGNRNRKPKNSLDKQISDDIILLYQTKYYDFNFHHFKEFLENNEKIKVSYNFIYKTLTNNNIYSPKIRKKTIRNIKKAEVLKAKENQKKSDDEIEVMVSHMMNLSDSHPRQEKPKYFGEVIEMDGSIHNWFGEDNHCLHLPIDLCTSRIVGAYFQKQETLKGYYTIYKQILDKYGIPLKFKTDNRTVFNYESLSKKKEQMIKMY